MNLKLLDNTPLKTSITRQENSIYLLKTIVDKNFVHLKIVFERNYRLPFLKAKSWWLLVHKTSM